MKGMLVCMIGLAVMLSPSEAQNSPQDFLAAHNAARAQVGVGPLTWDNTLAAYALNYANSQRASCPNLKHSGGPYGENLAAGSGGFTGRQAVELWVAERSKYNYASNSCADGAVCGHYTQVVWRNTVRVGCARVACTNGWWYVICSYAPPGNWAGQRPY